MRTQHEKNKEILMEEIEKLCDRPMNDAVAAKLNTYHGALKAMCWMEKEWEDEPDSTGARTAKKPEPTPELDGDTEFEQVLMTIPMDTAHIMDVFKIFNTHMIQMEVLNNKAYTRIIDSLKEVARS